MGSNRNKDVFEIVSSITYVPVSLFSQRQFRTHALASRDVVLD